MREACAVPRQDTARAVGRWPVVHGVWFVRATNGQLLSSSPALFLLGAALGRLWLLWLCPVVRDLAARLRQPMCTFVSVCGVAARRPCLAQSSGGL